MEMVLKIHCAAAFSCIELHPMVMCQVHFGKGWVKIKGCNGLFSSLRENMEHGYFIGVISVLSVVNHYF